MKKTTTLFLMLAILAFGAIFAGFNYPSSPPSAEKAQKTDVGSAVAIDNIQEKSIESKAFSDFAFHQAPNRTGNIPISVAALTSRKNIREVFAENYRENYKGKKLVSITRKTKFSNLTNFDNERFDGFGVDTLARAKV